MLLHPFNASQQVNTMLSFPRLAFFHALLFGGKDGDASNPLYLLAPPLPGFNLLLFLFFPDILTLHHLYSLLPFSTQNLTWIYLWSLIVCALAHLIDDIHFCVVIWGAFRSHHRQAEPDAKQGTAFEWLINNYPSSFVARQCGGFFSWFGCTVRGVTSFARPLFLFFSLF
jgi:hypothetical protein